MTTSTPVGRADSLVIGLVGLAHLLSHFYQIALAPLFPLLRDEFDVSYTALGLIVSLFYGVSGVSQAFVGIPGKSTAAQMFRPWSTISEYEISPVSGMAILDAETAKPPMKAPGYPARSISRADMASKQPGSTKTSGPARSLRSLSA